MPPPRLFLYRIKVEISPGEGMGNDKVQDYYVAAPTQCSATRHTALRPEVVNVLYVEGIGNYDGRDVTFLTYLDCP